VKTINMHEAKTKLSKVVREVLKTGEVYLLCRNGTPVAEIRAYVPSRNVLKVDRRLAVKLKGNPSAPLDKEDWPEAFE
jgi:antitoxin (DNA-binding transcriptional repressor) of toxin-antitoxin stability system